MDYAKVDHGVWCIRPDGHFLEEVVVFSPSGGRATPYTYTNMSAAALERISVPNVSDNWQEFRANLERKGFTVLSDDPTDEEIGLIRTELSRRYKEGVRILFHLFAEEMRNYANHPTVEEKELCVKRGLTLSKKIVLEEQRHPITPGKIRLHLAQRALHLLP